MAIKTKATRVDFKNEKDVPAREVTLTAKNWSSAIDWCKGEGRVTILKSGEEKAHRVRVRTPQGVRVAEIGDAIVKVGRGAKASFYVIKA